MLVGSYLAARRRKSGHLRAVEEFPAVAARLGRLSFTVLASESLPADATAAQATSKPVYAGEVSSAFPDEAKAQPLNVTVIKVFSGTNKPEEYQF